jgi:hypothetical protein
MPKVMALTGNDPYRISLDRFRFSVSRSLISTPSRSLPPVRRACLGYS